MAKKGEVFNPECIQKTMKYPASVIVLECFSYTGMGCMKFVEKTLKSDDYQQILKDAIPPTIEEQYPEENAIFQQDLAQWQKSKSTKKWLAKEILRCFLGQKILLIWFISRMYGTTLKKLLVVPGKYAFIFCEICIIICIYSLKYALY